MANSARVTVDFPVIATFVGLVTEEVDGAVGDATRLLGLGLEVTKAVGLVPAGWEDIERDLTSNRESVDYIST